MESLAVFAVAGNILQFTELGLKVIKKSVEYKENVDGMTQEQHDLELIVSLLSNLNTQLESECSLRGTISDAEKTLRQANSTCMGISKDFITLLSSLKLEGVKSKAKRFRIVMKALWKQTELNSLEQRLSQARANLTLAYLIYMQNQNENGGANMRNSFDLIERGILDALDTARYDLRNDLTKLTADLSLLHITDEQVLSRVTKFQSDHAVDIQNLTEKIEGMLGKQRQEKATQTARLIRRSLDFEQLQERQSCVVPAAADTFSWILHPTLQGNGNQPLFTVWLSMEGDMSDIFWIYGKAACGKSTLMQYLWQRNIEIHDYLLPWVGTRELSTAHCFFWNAGNHMQKSLHGLLRSVLFQLLENRLSDIRELVRPQLWADAFTEGANAVRWSNEQLLELLTSLTTRNPDDQCFFFFIDGLDEFEGSEEEREMMIEVLIKLASTENVKMCVSSRPWNIFFDAFGHCPQLRVENLTACDILKYITQQLSKSRRFWFLVGNDFATVDDLIALVAQKADGVFLWVKIVISQLLTGIRDGDDIKTLFRRLDDIPQGLEDLFERMFNSIGKQYLRESSVLLQVMLHARDCPADQKQTLIGLSHLNPSNPDFVLDDDFSVPDKGDYTGYHLRLERAVRRINSRSMGLLESRYNPSLYFAEGHQAKLGNPNLSLTVNFLHRTASDFFALDLMRKRLHDISSGPFPVRSFCCNTMVLDLFQNSGRNDNIQPGSDYASIVNSLVNHSTREEDEEEVCSRRLLQRVEELLQQSVNLSEIIPQDGVSAEIYQCWSRYNNNLLTTAIQYGQHNYTKRILTRAMVLNRKGRPYLDYALWYQPQLRLHDNDLDRVSIVQHILSLGANPNEEFEGRSIWVAFLHLIIRKCRYRHYLLFARETVTLMVDYGADIQSTVVRDAYDRALHMLHQPVASSVNARNGRKA